MPAVARPADPHENRILVDVDGVITTGVLAGPYQPDKFAPLQTGVRAFLGGLKDRGLEVVIFSARSPVEIVKQFFRANDLDRYVDRYTRTKLPSKVILDDRAIQFQGNFQHALTQIDSFKPHWKERDTIHEFSSIMAYMPPEIGAAVQKIAANIPDADLSEKGREEEPHVTIKWGIHGDDPAGAKQALEGKGSAKVKLGDLSLFSSDEHDVLKIDVESPDLHSLNAAVNRSCPHTDTFPDYRPHVTVAYLKPGMGKKYVGSSELSGKEAALPAAVFSDRNDRRHIIKLG